MNSNAPGSSSSSSKKRKRSTDGNQSEDPAHRQPRVQNPFQKLLNDYRDRDKKKELPTTNTRIPIDGKKYSGGRWHIPDEEYPEFLELYRTRVLEKGQVDRLTESHRKDGLGPILMDFDFKYPPGTEERMVDGEAMENLIDCLLEELALAYEVDADTSFDVFIFQKENIVPGPSYVKDGVHVLITVQSTKVVQRVMRLQSLPRLAEIFADLPLETTWDKIYDDGMSQGDSPWPLYGCRKPPSVEAYLVTRQFRVTVSDSDQFEREELYEFKDPGFFKDHLHLLSARNTRDLAELQTTVQYTDLCVQMIAEDEEKKRTALAAQAMVVSSNEMDLTAFTYNADLMISLLLDCQTVDDIEEHYQEFLTACEIDDYDLVTVSKYVMILGADFFEPGSYAKRSAVCWALKSISPKLLVTWVRFMFRRDPPDFERMTEWIDMWRKAPASGVRAKCIGLIKKRARESDLQAMTAIEQQRIDFYLKITIRSVKNGKKNGKQIMGSSDSDFAKLMEIMFDGLFVCVQLDKDGNWYQFDEHRWQPVEQGTTLRGFITDKLRPLYMNMMFAAIHESSGLDPEDPYAKTLTAQIDKLEFILESLGSCTRKDKIMKECKHLFYDKSIFSKLDTKHSYSLICFKNGVFEIDTGKFRPGRPDDYISVCTNQNYLETLLPEHDIIVQEIHDYMSSMFPIPDVCETMYEMLAVILHGDVTQNQIMFYLHGEGQNGKGIFTEQLLPNLFGEYFGTLKRNFYLSEDEKVGGTNTDVADMVAKRCLVTSEMTKGSSICEAPFKQATSGTDEMKGRRVFAPTYTKFFSQFVPIICSNNFIGIKSMDRGTWRRIAVVNCIAYFTDTPDPTKPYQFKRKNISKMMDRWYEVFLHLLVQRVVKNKGKITLSKTIVEDTRKYRKTQDNVAEFVYDNLIRDDYGTLCTAELNCKFKEWLNVMKGVQHRGNYNDLHNYVNQYFEVEMTKLKNTWSGVRFRTTDDPIDAEYVEAANAVQSEENRGDEEGAAESRKRARSEDAWDVESVASAKRARNEGDKENVSPNRKRAREEYVSDSDSILRGQVSESDARGSSSSSQKKTKRRVLLKKNE